MPVEQTPDKQRNWYKVATIVLSSAMVVITFISGVYYKRIDDRTKRLNKIESKIDKLHLQKEKIVRIPKVAITLMTLEESGLPQSAFDNLAEIPAVLRIKHSGGDTAKGITVNVSSSSNIIKFLPEPSVEKFSHEIDEDKRNLRLEIKQMRRDSNIQGTIMCSEMASLEVKPRIDAGTILNQAENKTLTTSDPFIRFNELDKIVPSSISSVEEIELTDRKLRFLLSREREKSIFDDIPTTYKIIGSTLTIISIAGMLVFIREAFDRKITRKVREQEYQESVKANDLGNIIGRAKQSALIKIDMPQNEVEQLLGPPTKVIFDNNNGEEAEKWFYTPTASKEFGWQPDATVTFKNSKVHGIEYIEYGKRDYS